MKKVRKGKKMLMFAAIIVIAIIIAIVLIVTKVVNKKSDDTQTSNEESVIALPDTTYSDMQVNTVYMEYLADQDKTMVSMSILNTTTQKVEDESLNAILVGDNENVLGQMETWIQSLSAGEQYDISVILNGNLTGTKLIKLEKVTNNQ